MIALLFGGSFSLSIACRIDSCLTTTLVHPTALVLRFSMMHHLIRFARLLPITSYHHSNLKQTTDPNSSHPLTTPIPFSHVCHPPNCHSNTADPGPSRNGSNRACDRVGPNPKQNPVRNDAPANPCVCAHNLCSVQDLLDGPQYIE